MAFDNSGVPYLLIEDNREDAPYRFNYWKRTGPEQWEPGHFDDGSITTPAQRFGWEGMVFDSANEPINLGAYTPEGGTRTLSIYRGSGAGFSSQVVLDDIWGSNHLLLDGEAVMVISTVSPTSDVSGGASVRLEGASKIEEDIFTINQSDGYGGVGESAAIVNGTVYCAWEEFLKGGVIEIKEKYLSHRVDPRL